MSKLSWLIPTSIYGLFLSAPLPTAQEHATDVVVNKDCGVYGLLSAKERLETDVVVNAVLFLLRNVLPQAQVRPPPSQDRFSASRRVSVEQTQQVLRLVRHNDWWMIVFEAYNNVWLLNKFCGWPEELYLRHVMIDWLIGCIRDVLQRIPSQQRSNFHSKVGSTPICRNKA